MKLFRFLLTFCLCNIDTGFGFLGRFETTINKGNVFDQVFTVTNQPHLEKNLKINPHEICNPDHFSLSFELHSYVPKKKVSKV